MFRLFACLLMPLLLSFTASAASLWNPEPAGPSDARRAIPNNAAPPDRNMPEHRLQPLPKEEEGNIRSVKVGEKVVALTFDLCELSTVTTGYNAESINFLREKKIPATLFMGGKWMRTHSERVMQLMVDPLFEIGNHAWAHGNFGIMDEKSMLEQIRWTQAEYELLRAEALARARAEGREASIPESLRLFRLPYGRCSDRALSVLAQEGLQVVQWSVVAETEKDNAAQGLAGRVVGQVRPGAIILFHANCVPQHSEVLLRAVVEELIHKGYRFVTVSELLRLGEPQRFRNGYFNHPGDNLALDTQFGVDGTGRKH